MKKTLLFAIILFVGILNVKAQSRTNKVMLEFNSKTPKITSAVGWMKNDKTGKWIENKNVVSDKKVSSSWKSHVSQNFKWLQFSTITKNGKDYYVFLYEKEDGEYKYPNIYEDWKPEIRTCFVVFSKAQYNKIKTQVQLNTGKNIKMTSKISGYMSDRFKILGGEHLYNEDNLLAKITKAIETPSYSNICFIINAQVTDGANVLRFRIPESCYSSEEKMATAYFEVKSTVFNTILNLNSTAIEEKKTVVKKKPVVKKEPVIYHR
jgi:hypothetical protein